MKYHPDRHFEFLAEISFEVFVLRNKSKQDKGYYGGKSTYNEEIVAIPLRQDKFSTKIHIKPERTNLSFLPSPLSQTRKLRLEGGTSRGIREDQGLLDASLYICTSF